jgi:hypothetical protein
VRGFSNKIAKMKKLLNKIIKKKDELDLLEQQADIEINKICAFEAGLTFCEGDGYLIINTETTNVANLGLLNGKTETNKLTEAEHEKYSI